MAATKKKAKRAKKTSKRSAAKPSRKAAKPARKKAGKARSGHRTNKGAQKPSKADDGKYGRRADYGASVDEFVAALPEEKRAIVNALREIVRDAVPDVVESIRWGMPVFSRKKLICYASPKSSYVRFGFYERIDLDDPDKRLAGALAYVKLSDVSEIEPPLLRSWIQQVVAHTDA